MQWKSRGSPLSTALGSPSTCARRPRPDTRRMLMSLSQQNACRSVKWICRAISSWSSSSVARTHSTTQSGSLRVRGIAISEDTASASLVRKATRTSIYLHIHELCRLVHADGEAVLSLRGHQQLLQRVTHGVHPVKKRAYGQRLSKEQDNN